MGTLRFLLALSVLIGHAHGLFGFFLFEGNLAVRAFYAISGFYMTLVITEKYGRSNQYPWIRSFWMSRYFRLAPTYLFITVLVLIFGIFYGNLGVFKEASLTALLLVAVSQITLIGQDVFMFCAYDTINHAFIFMPDVLQNGLKKAGETFVQGHRFLLIPQGWSIGVEVWFYLLAPFLVLRRLKVIISIMLLSLLIRLFLSYGMGWQEDPWNYRFFPSELFTFLLGTLAYKGYRQFQNHPSFQNFSQYSFGFILTLLVAYPYLPGGNTEKRWLFLLILTASLPNIFALTKQWKLDRWNGKA
jgi:peptidoglycan/LPS O-acetylase OafA/YrhL